MAKARKAHPLTGLLKQIQESPEPAHDLMARFRDGYKGATREQRVAFLDDALRSLEVPSSDLDEIVESVARDPGDEPLRWTGLLTELRRRLESPRMRAFRRFVNAPGGMKFLLDLRADVLKLQKQEGLDLSALDEEIAHLFTSWFQHGFLFVQEITQESSYRQIRFLKDHDMVHPMASLEEMGSRLGQDRRAFALYHRAIPEEPVVFIEVALTRRIPRTIHEILDAPAERARIAPDTAIFYSINNAQNGLAGLGLGKVLIFRVVEALKRELPDIRTFATLSPVPGFFGRYVTPILTRDETPFRMTRKELIALFGTRAERRIRARVDAPREPFATVLLDVLSRPDWIEDEVFAAELERPLQKLTYYHLIHEKDARGRPANPVANFHMGNGARLSYKNVHFGANRTTRGVADACGMMVSYVYSSTWGHELRRTARYLLPWEV